MNSTLPIILVMGRAGISLDLMVSALSACGRIEVMIESSPSVLQTLRLKKRMVGVAALLDQVLFRMALPFVSVFFRRRRAEMESALIARYPKIETMPYQVDNVNSKAARRIIGKLEPQVVVLCGTRIVGPKTLTICRNVINLHLGITPNYRGVHGGYWAAANRDLGNFGSTVHLVNEGVDTGAVLAHVRTTPSPIDGYLTFPLVQLGGGLAALVNVITKLLAGEQLSPVDVDGQASRQYFHPGLSSYLWNGFSRGIW